MRSPPLAPADEPTSTSVPCDADMNTTAARLPDGDHMPISTARSARRQESRRRGQSRDSRWICQAALDNLSPGIFLARIADDPNDSGYSVPPSHESGETQLRIQGQHFLERIGMDQVRGQVLGVIVVIDADVDVVDDDHIALRKHPEVTPISTSTSYCAVGSTGRVVFLPRTSSTNLTAER